MKKKELKEIYECPRVEVLIVENEGVLAASGVESYEWDGSEEEI